MHTASHHLNKCPCTDGADESRCKVPGAHLFTVAVRIEREGHTEPDTIVLCIALGIGKATRQDLRSRWAGANMSSCQQIMFAVAWGRPQPRMPITIMCVCARGAHCDNREPRVPHGNAIVRPRMQAGTSWALCSAWLAAVWHGLKRGARARSASADCIVWLPKFECVSRCVHMHASHRDHPEKVPRLRVEHIMLCKPSRRATGTRALAAASQRQTMMNLLCPTSLWHQIHPSLGAAHADNTVRTKFQLSLGTCCTTSRGARAPHHFYPGCQRGRIAAVHRL